MRRLRHLDPRRRRWPPSGLGPVIRAATAPLTGIAISLLATSIANAADPHGIAGDYICKSGCRVTDAPPNIEIKGAVAYCRSELGGIYTGQLLTRTSVSCFNTLGTLSGDGQQILWGNGNVWERRSAPPAGKLDGSGKPH